MSEYRFNFLNWAPDKDDVGNDGLVTADNVVHSPEGYREIHLGSSGVFATTGGLAATTQTILSVVSKPVGASGDQFVAWLADATTPTLYVGINGVTATTAATGHPLAFSTAVSNPEIWAFDVCEYGGKICFTVEARGETASSSALAVAMAGYMTY